MRNVDSDLMTSFVNKRDIYVSSYMPNISVICLEDVYESVDFYIKKDQIVSFSYSALCLLIFTILNSHLTAKQHMCQLC